MSKHDAAPTHGYIITSHVNRFVVRVCLFLFAALALAVATLVMRVNADCSDQPSYDWKAFGYELHVRFNKDYDVCMDKPVIVSP